MSYQIKQTRRFARIYKKLHDNVIKEVDTAVQAVADNPQLGERKKGDLAQLLVYKFRSQGQLYLLGYMLDESIRLIYLEAIGSHATYTNAFIET